MTAHRSKILLTGGSGFIGRNFLESPAFRRFDLVAPRHHQLDLTDEIAVREFLLDEKVNAVVHTAIKPGHRNATDSSQLLLANLRMFYNLARNMDVVKRMVIIGSGAIYDNRFYGAKRVEDSYIEHVPVDEHGFAKYVVEKYIEQAEQIYDLRVFGIYGKYEDYQIRFISNMICKALHGLPLTIKQDRRFDYIFIDDLAPVVAKVLSEGLPWPSINVTPDESVSLMTIANIVLEEVHRTDLPIVVAQSGEGLEYSGDNTRLRQWMPELNLTSLREGIRALVAWYRDNWASIDKQKLEVDP